VQSRGGVRVKLEDVALPYTYPSLLISCILIDLVTATVSSI